MDLIIDTLIVDEHRIEHIARHQASIEEVQEGVSGDYVFIQGHHERWLLIGKTRRGRFLRVVVGARSQANTSVGHRQAGQPGRAKLLSRTGVGIRR